MRKIKHRISLGGKKFVDVLLEPVKRGDEILVKDQRYTVEIISEVNIQGVPKIWLGVSKGWKCKMSAKVQLYPVTKNDAQILDCVLPYEHKEGHAFIVKE